MSTRYEAKLQAAIGQAEALPEIGSLSELRGTVLQTLQATAELEETYAAEASEALIQTKALFVAKSITFILEEDELPSGLSRALRRFVRKLQSTIDALSLQISKGVPA